MKENCKILRSLKEICKTAKKSWDFQVAFVNCLSQVSWPSIHPSWSYFFFVSNHLLLHPSPISDPPRHLISSLFNPYSPLSFPQFKLFLSLSSLSLFLTHPLCWHQSIHLSIDSFSFSPPTPLLQIHLSTCHKAVPPISPLFKCNSVDPNLNTYF